MRRERDPLGPEHDGHREAGGHSSSRWSRRIFRRPLAVGVFGGLLVACGRGGADTDFAEFCRLGEQLREVGGQAVGGDQSAREQLDGLHEDLRSVAPDDVLSDLDTFVEEVQRVVSLSDEGTDPATVQPDPEAVAAGERFVDELRIQCSVDRSDPDQ